MNDKKPASAGRDESVADAQEARARAALERLPINPLEENGLARPHYTAHVFVGAIKTAIMRGIPPEALKRLVDTAADHGGRAAETYPRSEALRRYRSGTSALAAALENPGKHPIGPALTELGHIDNLLRKSGKERGEWVPPASGGIAATNERGGIAATNERGGIAATNERGGIATMKERGGIAAGELGGQPPKTPSAVSGVTPGPAESLETARSVAGNAGETRSIGPGGPSALPPRGLPLLSGAAKDPDIAAYEAVLKSLPADELVRRVTESFQDFNRLKDLDPNKKTATQTLDEARLSRSLAAATNLARASAREALGLRPSQEKESSGPAKPSLLTPATPAQAAAGPKKEGVRAKPRPRGDRGM